ncbi:MAG: MSCRAMM family protein [Oscillochloridaceae bacterium umkhey_bin13]
MQRSTLTFSTLRLVIAGCVLLLVTALLPHIPNSQAAPPQPTLEANPPRSLRPALLMGSAVPNGLPQAGLLVSLTQEDALLQVTTTDAAGMYHFFVQEEGSYQVRAYDATDHTFAIEAISLQPGTTAMLDLGAPLVQPGASLAAEDDRCAALPPGTATIRGVVTAAATGEPVNRVRVTADGPNTESVNTDATGAYTITNLAAGSYSLRFQPRTDNPIVQFYDGKWDAEFADRVVVAEGATVNNINAALVAPAIISGTVTTVNNEPISGVRIDAYRVVNGARVFAMSGSTNSEGNYRITSLPPGTYVVATDIRASSNATALPFFNQSSQQLTVDAASSNPNVNFQLVRGAQFSGRVTDSDGAGLRNVSVYAYDALTNQSLGLVASTGTDGTFISRGLRPGSYKVGFELSAYNDVYYNAQTNLTQATPITLTAATVTPNIDAQMSRGGKGSITGRVTNTEGQGLSGVVIFAYGPGFRITSTNEDGTYRIDNLTAGEYEIEFRPLFTSEGYIPQYYNNQPNRGNADLVTVTAPNTTSNINAVLVRGARISGCVSASDTGRGISSVRVRVQSTDARFSDSFSTISTGIYRTTGLPPGTYRVEFIGSSASNTRLRPGYAGKDHAAPIVIAATDVGGINAVLDPGGAFRGTVTDGDGNPLSGILASVQNLDGSNATSSATSSTDAGIFTSAVVAPGRYLLELEPSSSGANTAFARRILGPFEITADAFTLVDTQLALGGRISGRVTNSTGAGLPDVSVFIYDANRRFVNSATTGSDGRYTTPGLADGSYYLWFWPFGASAQYAPLVYNNKPDLQSADPVQVQGTGTVANINAVLVVGSAISGQVNAPTGFSVEGTLVQVYNAANQLVRTASVGADGRYITPALPSGTYRVCFRPQLGRLLAVCYNNKPDLASADPITVTAPTPVENINASLVAGSQISGRVRDAAGNGLAGVRIEVRAQATLAADDPILATATTNADGSYTTSPGLPAGNYRLRFIPPAGSGLGATSREVSVATTGTDVESIDLQLSTSFPVYLPLIRR